MISPDPLLTQSPAQGAPAQAHRWRRAISRRDLRASAKPSDWADDRPGSWAQPVKPGARAGDSAHHEGASRGRCEHGVELRPLHRGWGWAGQGGGVRSSSAHSSKIPALPPAPASSTAVVWQPLRSPSAPCLYGASPVGLPSSSVAGAGVSLHRHPSILQLHRAPSSLRLRLGRASTRHRLRTPLLRLRLVAPSHRLRWAPSSLQLHLGPQSLRLRRGSPDLHLRLGRQSPRLHPGPPDPLHPPGSLALRLRFGLLHHLLRRRWSAPWSRRQSLLHGSSLRRLHRGPSSWLWPGSSCAPPAPGPSCLFPGSSLLRHLPGLCQPAPPGCSSSSWASALVPTRFPPPLLFHGARTHLPGGGSNVTPLDCFVVFLLHVFCDPVSPSCLIG